MQKLFVRFVLVALAASPVRVPGQSGLWGSRDAYLGQKPVSDTPQIFALDVLAKKDTFSLVNAKIRYFRFEGGRWRGPFVGELK